MKSLKIHVKTLTVLCLMILFGAISCTKIPPNEEEKEEEPVLPPEEEKEEEKEDLVDLLDVELEEYETSVYFKNRPGLYLEDGILKHEGEAFAGIGANFYGAFSNYFVENRKEFNNIFALLAGHGIGYCRINIGLYHTADYKRWGQNKEMYFKRLDEVIRAAEHHNIGLICSFFWTFGVAGYFDETELDWGKANSMSHKFMAQYARLFVKRYMESPAIWGYEFGNEINLQCDIPHIDNGFKAEWIQPLLQEFAEIVKKNDPYGRIVTSGCSEPRPSQYNLRMNNSWKTDTREEWAQALTWFNPPPMGCNSVHIYDPENRFLPSSQNTYTNLIKAYMEESAKQRKALFIGEFHGLNNKCEEIIDAIVANRAPISAVWAVGTVEYSLSADPSRQNAVLNYIEDANKKLKNK